MRQLLFCVPLVAACVIDEPTTDSDGTTRLHTSGSFAGRYEVPTNAELGPAARYPVDHIDWTVVGDTATLHYELPAGLVGGEVEVTLTGPIDRAARTASLMSHIGTGSCSVAGTVVTCHEAFMNLGALPISLAVVEQRAALEYAGPAHHRIAIAHMFASEPLGIAVFDLSTPSLDDSDEDKDDDKNDHD